MGLNPHPVPPLKGEGTSADGAGMAESRGVAIRDCVPLIAPLSVPPLKGEGRHTEGFEACGCPDSYWMAASISSIQAARLASRSVSLIVKVLAGCGRVPKAGLRSAPRSTTGNIQLVVGMIAWAAGEAR